MNPVLSQKLNVKGEVNKKENWSFQTLSESPDTNSSPLLLLGAALALEVELSLTSVLFTCSYLTEVTTFL